MVEVRVKKLWVKNFKSLKDFELNLSKVNVIVGPNGSGKSNIVESFKLLREILDCIKGRKVNPFLAWWGYGNVVWNGEENLPITIGYEYEISKEKENPITASYEITIIGIGGEFEILREGLFVPKVDITLKTTKKGKFEVFFGKKALDIRAELKILEALDFPPDIRDGFASFLTELIHKTIEKLVDNPIEIEFFSSSIIDFVREIEKWGDDESSKLGFMGDVLEDYISSGIHKISDKILSEIELPGKLLEFYEKLRPFQLQNLININFDDEKLALAAYSIYLLIDSIILLRQLKYEDMKNPSRLVKDFVISEDGSNILSVLFSLGKGEIPKRIVNAIKYAFGEDTRVFLELTSDGRIFLKFREKGETVEFNPPSLPDGLYKLMALELALEAKAPIIVVDEVENSLHAELIQYILDEFRSSNSTVILTTHSPAVVDISKPEEIVILEKDLEGATKVYRYKKPEEIHRKLHELGVTLSEYILHAPR